MTFISSTFLSKPALRTVRKRKEVEHRLRMGFKIYWAKFHTLTLRYWARDPGLTLNGNVPIQ